MITPEGQIFRALLTRLKHIERRIDGATSFGKVTEVDVDRGKARIAIGKNSDGDVVLSPWSSYAQTGGDLKIHSVPTVGQLMKLTGEAGDVEQGLLEPMQWTDDNPDNHDAADVHRLTFGEVTIDLKAGGIYLTAGGVTFELSANGFHQTGGTLTHDGVPFDKDHIHGGVMPSSGVSGPPQ